MAIYNVHNNIRKKATIFNLITNYFFCFGGVLVASILFFFLKPSFLLLIGLGIGNAVLYFILYFIQDFDIDNIKTLLPDILINN